MGLFETKPTKNQGITCENRASERGNVMIWILIAVALFAALNYVTSQGSRTSAGNFSEEVAALAANEIMEYGQTIRRVVQELQINGCDETEISFENTFVSGYLNANAPTDESCHVFSPSGGGLRYVAPETDWLNGDYAAVLLSDGRYGKNYFISGFRIAEVSTTENDLLMVLNFLNREICMQVNNNLGITNLTNDAPEDTAGVASPVGEFTGVFGTSNPDPIGDDVNGYLTAKTAGCWKNSANNVYQYYQVLKAR